VTAFSLQLRFPKATSSSRAIGQWQAAVCWPSRGRWHEPVGAAISEGLSPAF